MRTQDYRLPDGRIVAIHANVSRGAQTISYYLRAGICVTATLVREERVSQLTDTFDRRLAEWRYPVDLSTEVIPLRCTRVYDDCRCIGERGHLGACDFDNSESNIESEG